MRMRPGSLILLILVVFALGACNNSLGGIPLAAAPGPLATPGALIFHSPADATATPTPFQPLQPTAIYVPSGFPTPTALPPTPEGLADSGPVAALERPADQVTILLLGADARPRSTIFRTDTIILASLNPSQGTVSLLSFPRDLYVQIPGWGMDRINTAWARGGYKKLASTIEYNFGVRPQHYVLINFSNFKQLIDSLGGLEVRVGETVSDYYRGRWTTIRKGKVRMDADMVLWYVRTRKTSNDFARNRRQQEVLEALLAKFISMNAIRRAPELYAVYKDSVTTDLKLIDMLPFIPLAAQLSDTSRLRQYYISSKIVTNYITPGGAMVLLPNRSEVLKIVRRAINGEK